MGYQALLFCSDEKTARVVARILGELEFAVESCSEPFAAVKQLTTEHFDALVVDCEDEQNATLLFRSARNSSLNHSSLAVALVEGQAGIAKAFRIGANLVLTKPINIEQSKGTLRVARGLLRKADAAKPTAAAVSPEPPSPPDASSLESFSTPAPALAAPKLAFTPAPPKTIVPPAPVASAWLEVEEESLPALGAEEAALLESMPDPAPPPPAAGAEASKGYSWQPPSASLAGSASAPPPTATVQSDSISRAIPSPTSQSTRGENAEMTESRPQASGLSFEKGAATAIAPAREIPNSVIDLFEAKPLTTTPQPTEAPATGKPRTRTSPPASRKSTGRSTALAGEKTTFAVAGGEREAASPAKESSKKNLVIAAVLVVSLAAAGYFAWPRLQPSVMSLPIVQKYFGSRPRTQASAAVSPAAPVSVPVPAPAAAAAPVATSPQPPASAADAAAAPAQTSPADSPAPAQPAESAPAALTSLPQPIAATPSPRVSASRAAAAAKAPEPIIVKDDRKRNASSKPDAAQPVAPAPLEVASNAGDKAIAGIVGGGVGVRPVLKTVRVSQGVSNGLLTKRVSPIYPSLALQMRVGGAVDLEATITKDGNTSDIKVLKGDPMLRQAAVDAVRKWKYKPYFLDAQPVEIQTEITVNFVLPQ